MDSVSPSHQSVVPVNQTHQSVSGSQNHPSVVYIDKHPLLIIPTVKVTELILSAGFRKDNFTRPFPVTLSLSPMSNCFNLDIEMSLVCTDAISLLSRGKFIMINALLKLYFPSLFLVYPCTLCIVFVKTNAQLRSIVRFKGASWGIQWWLKKMPASDSLKTHFLVRDSKSSITANGHSSLRI